MFFCSSFFHFLHCIISPRLASKHGRADRCVASSMDKISHVHSIPLSFFTLSYAFILLLLTSVSPSALILALFIHMSFLFSLIPALQTWPVYRQRTGCHTCGGGMGRVDSFWYLFADMWRGHQDRCARMQPTHVSSPALCSLACQVNLVSILAARVNVP